jgi:hypothetical protein
MASISGVQKNSKEFTVTFRNAGLQSLRGYAGNESGLLPGSKVFNLVADTGDAQKNNRLYESLEQVGIIAMNTPKGVEVPLFTMEEAHGLLGYLRENRYLPNAHGTVLQILAHTKVIGNLGYEEHGNRIGMIIREEVRGTGPDNEKIAATIDNGIRPVDMTMRKELDPLCDNIIRDIALKGTRRLSR